SLPFDLDAAHELYHQLFGQVEEIIKGKHLLLVLSGPLNSLPPHLLVTAQPTTAIPTTKAGYRGVSWLARKHAITILPSVSSLPSVRAQSTASPKTATATRAPRRYIGLGNPILAGNERCAKVQVPKSCSQLLSLAASQQALRHSGSVIDSS